MRGQLFCRLLAVLLALDCFSLASEPPVVGDNVSSWPSLQAAHLVDVSMQPHSQSAHAVSISHDALVSAERPSQIRREPLAEGLPGVLAPAFAQQSPQQPTYQVPGNQNATRQMNHQPYGGASQSRGPPQSHGYGHHRVLPVRVTPVNIMQAENTINKFDREVMKAEREAGFPIATSSTTSPEEVEELKWEDRELNALWSLVAVGILLALGALCFSLQQHSKTASLEAQHAQLLAQLAAQGQLPVQQGHQQSYDQQYGEEQYQQNYDEQTGDLAHQQAYGDQDAR